MKKLINLKLKYNNSYVESSGYYYGASEDRRFHWEQDYHNASNNMHDIKYRKQKLASCICFLFVGFSLRKFPR